MDILCLLIFLEIQKKRFATGLQLNWSESRNCFLNWSQSRSCFQWRQSQSYF